MENAVTCRACGKELAHGQIESDVHYVLPDGKKLDYSLYRCPACTLGFWWPMEQPPLVFYQKMYANFAWDDVSRDFPDTEDFLEMAHGLQGKLLDVGCGSGAFLYQLKTRRAPFQLWGVDLLPEGVERIKKTLGIPDVHAMPLGEFSKGEHAGAFDVVTSFNVIEHAGDPVPFMESVKRLLKKGGTTIFVAPDANTYTAWAKIHNVAPNQFAWWNRKSLIALLEKQGFRDIVVKPIGHMAAIDVVMGPAVSLGLVKKKIDFSNYGSLGSTDF